MTSSSKHIALWLVLALVFVVIFSAFNKQYRREPEIIFSEFMGGVERGDVREVVIQGHNIQGKYKNGEQFRTFEPDDPELVKSLRDKDVKIAAKPEDESPDAGGRWQGDVFWQEPRKTAYGESTPRNL